MTTKTLLLILGGLFLAEYGTGLVQAASGSIPPSPPLPPTPISPPAPTSGGGTTNVAKDITTGTGTASAVIGQYAAVTGQSVSAVLASIGHSFIALATNPITWGVAAAIGIAVLWYKSQAHHEADEWVQGFQNPFDSKMAAIDNAVAAGSIDGVQAFALRKAQVADYIQAMNQFASQGDDQALVIRQAKVTFAYWYGADPDTYLANVVSELRSLGVAA